MPLVIALASLTLLLAFLTIHPFATYPVSLWLIRAFGGRRPVRIGAGPRPTSFSIVFCAYNEAKVIDAKLRNLLEIVASRPAGEVEVLVYDDCSVDGTRSILENYKQSARVFGGERRAGKSTGMNTLLQNARGDIVIFTDANVLLSRDVVPEFGEVFSDPDVGVALGHLIYTNSDTPTANVGTSYWRLEEIIKSLETETGAAMGADGSLFSIRRELYRPVPTDIIDDFFTSMSILCDGYRIVRCPKALAYETSADDPSHEYARKVRIGCRVFNCHRLLWPRFRRLPLLNLYKYISHRFLRWFAAVWFVVGALFAVSTLGAAFGWRVGLIALTALVSAFLAARLMAAARVPVLSNLWEVWLAFLGTSHGVWRSLRNDRFKTWEPVASARKIAILPASEDSNADASILRRER
jgi:glycosyltransferase involved in cell wall biosynthesis